MKNKKKNKGLSVWKISIEMDRKAKKSTNIKTDDYIERTDIHEEINRLIEYGLSEREVVERVLEKFPDSKYKMYFENWVKDWYKKSQKVNNSKKDEQER